MDKQNLNKVFKQVIDSLTLKDYEDLIVKTGGIITKKNNTKWICRTYCHHKNALNGKPKLEFYLSTKTFYCFSGCQQSYNIITLLQQRFKILGEEKNRVEVLKYIIDTCKLNIDLDNIKIKEKSNDICDWQKVLSKYTRYKSNPKENQIYDKSILDNLEDKYHIDWILEGISIETQQKFGIKWYNYRQQIVIPVFDDVGNFIGGHVRNLLPEAIEQGYKYMPFSSLSFDYNFNTGNILYGLNVNKENIRYTKTAILFEAPKSVMMLEEIAEYNNSVGNFGMNVQKIKRDLLMKYDCEVLIVAMDKQYKKQYKEGNFCDENGNEIKVKTEEYAKYVKIINKIIKLFKPYMQVDVILDTDELNLIGYKDSPVDKGKEVWYNLYNKRLRNVEELK